MSVHRNHEVILNTVWLQCNLPDYTAIYTVYKMGHGVLQAFF